MNWYKHHIGDYDSHTSHLSILEDGIYCRLLRRYYMTERPLPNDLQELAKLVRARSRSEVDALGRCVNYYFHVAADGLLHNSRADAEILKYQGQCETNRSIARARTVHGISTNRIPNQNLEPDTRKSFTPADKSATSQNREKTRKNGCHFDGCSALGTRSLSTTGSGPWYCEAHFEPGNGKDPKPILEHLNLPAKPQPDPTATTTHSKFDD